MEEPKKRRRGKGKLSSEEKKIQELAKNTTEVQISKDLIKKVLKDDSLPGISAKRKIVASATLTKALGGKRVTKRNVGAAYAVLQVGRRR